MNNWRELEAGLELDRIIAEAIGYTEIEEHKGWGEAPQEGSYEVEYLVGRKDRHEHKIPPYSHDAHYAMLLPLERDEYMVIDRQRGEIAAKVDHSHPHVNEGGEFGKEHNAALIICKAWLANKERRKQKEEV